MNFNICTYSEWGTNAESDKLQNFKKIENFYLTYYNLSKIRKRGVETLREDGLGSFTPRWNEGFCLILMVSMKSSETDFRTPTILDKHS